MMNMPEPGSPKSYLPFITFVPADLTGAEKDTLKRAEEIRFAYLQGSVEAADRWHDKLDELLALKRINEEQNEALHALVRETIEKMAKEVDADVWLQREPEQGAPDMHNSVKSALQVGMQAITESYKTKVATKDLEERLVQPVISDRAIDFPASSFQASVPTRDQGQITSDFSKTDTCIIFGPYKTLEPGAYIAYFHLSFRSDISMHGPEVTIDVAASGEVRATKSISVDDLRKGLSVTQLAFTHVKPEALIEYRVWTHGRPFYATLTFRGVTLDLL